MATVIFLAISAALWLPYGLFCFANPGFLAEAAGVSAGTTTGTVELRAMYGGLQAGIGTLALTAIWRETLRRPALLCILFLCAGLALEARPRRGHLEGPLLGSEPSEPEGNDSDEKREGQGGGQSLSRDRCH